MTTSLKHLPLILTLLLPLLIATVFAATSFQPKGLLFPVSKDSSTLQYIVKTTQRTPPKSVPLTLALGSPFLWQDCDKAAAYVSSTYSPARCNSAQCKLAASTSCGTCNSSPPRPGCNNNTCGLSPNNPFTNTATSGEIATDVIRINSTDGANLGPVVSVPDFLFSCAPTSLLKGLAKGVQGIAGFGKASKISIPSQLFSAFTLPQKFAICLTSSFIDDGVIFFGDGPYRIYPSLDVTASLSYTPLLGNPTTPSDYFIGVKAIKISGRKREVEINKSLLISSGTKFSTVEPYTILETSIYEAVSTAFDNQLRVYYQPISAGNNATRVKGVAPFKTCYDRSTMEFSRPGVQVPTIKLVLQSSKVVWSIYGDNSMVTVEDNVICLAFVDGGPNPSSAIVIGGYQLEDNFLQFDLAKSRLAFSNYIATRCGNFNFTTVVA